MFTSSFNMTLNVRNVSHSVEKKQSLNSNYANDPSSKYDDKIDSQFISLVSQVNTPEYTWNKLMFFNQLVNQFVKLQIS